MKTGGLRARYLITSVLIAASIPGSAMASGEDVLMEQITPASAAFSTALELPSAPVSLDVAQVATRYNSFGLVTAFADTVSLQVDRAALASGFVSHRIDNFGNVAQVIQIAQVPAAASDGGAPVELTLFGSQLNLGGFTGAYGLGGNAIEQVQSGTANFARAMQFGTNNAARQVQDGSQLASAIIQAGQNNRAETLQTGLLNQAAILQSGRDNFATIGQRGSSGFALVSQAGTGNIALVRQ